MRGQTVLQRPISPVYVDPAFSTSPYGGLPTYSSPAHRGSGDAVVHFPQYVKLLVAHGADSSTKTIADPR